MEIASGTTSAQSPLQRSRAIGTPRLKGLISRSLTWHLRAVLFVVATAFSGTFAYAEDCDVGFKSGSEMTDCLSKQFLSQRQLDDYLHWSIGYYDGLKVAEMLLERGADVNSVVDGLTPLKRAIIRRKDAFVQLFLDRGANPNIVDSHWGSALYLAVSARDMSLVKLLIEVGAFVDARNESGETPLFFAASQANLELVDLLLSNGANPNARDQWGRPILISPMFQGNLPILTTLLKAGADPNAEDNWGYTPLRLAQTPDMVQILVHYGADVNHRSSSNAVPEQSGRTALFCEKDAAIIAELVRYGADPTARDATGKTAMFCAASGEAVVALSRLGLSVHDRDSNGLTPLMQAIKSYIVIYEEPEFNIYIAAVVDTFLRLGSDPFAIDDLGNTAFDYAEANVDFRKTDAYWMVHDKRF
jgi:ankyrin repeat protein